MEHCAMECGRMNATREGYGIGKGTGFGVEEVLLLERKTKELVE